MNLKIIIYCSIISLLANSCTPKSDENLAEKNKSKIEKKEIFHDENQGLSYELMNQVIEDNIPSDKEIYILLQQDLTQPAILIDPEEEDYLGLNQYDSILSKKDIEYIYKKVTDLRISQDLDLNLAQINNQNVKIISTSQFNKFIEKTISKNQRSEFWEEFEKEFGIHNYYSISYPVFSLDKNTAIMSFGHHCGSLCGDGFSAIYQKINGKWIPVEYITNWVS